MLIFMLFMHSHSIIGRIIEPLVPVYALQCVNYMLVLFSGLFFKFFVGAVSPLSVVQKIRGWAH